MSLKRFLIILTTYLFLFGGFYVFTIYKTSKSKVDQFYNKFTQDSGSLIVGLSRADQGISPYILEDELKNFNFDMPLVNFSMNAHQSAFGKTYLDGISKKLSTNNNNGLFIVSVCPGNFIVRLGILEDKIYDLDKESIIGSISNLTQKPNFEYIISKYEKPLYGSFFNKKSTYFTSHANGWNEVVLKTENNDIDKKDLAYWKKQNMDYYSREMNNTRISEYRKEYFIKTIEFLKTKGEVFIIRMPSDLDVVKFENDNWENFDYEMDSICNKYNVQYFNYSKQSNNFTAYDASHLESESAQKFTKLLSLDIKKSLSENK